LGLKEWPWRVELIGSMVGVLDRYVLRARQYRAALFRDKIDISFMMQPRDCTVKSPLS